MDGPMMASDSNILLDADGVENVTYAEHCECTYLSYNGSMGNGLIVSPTCSVQVTCCPEISPLTEKTTANKKMEPHPLLAYTKSSASRPPPPPPTK
ncbi:unnamed protein product [Allacma fusca]|uniref:Uncharacterized protein n=1 Tax=Allacma fusca TaxID=39272 RepID=A0A8J2NKS9_9HEXA|nr:unnamed protein product [Allacma fusca]